MGEFATWSLGNKTLTSRVKNMMKWFISIVSPLRGTFIDRFVLISNHRLPLIFQVEMFAGIIMPRIIGGLYRGNGCE